MDNSKFYKFIKNTVGPIINFFLRIKVEGIENIPKEGKAVLAGTHRNFFDPCVNIISTKRQIHFLAKDKFYDKPFFKQLFKGMGCIRVISVKDKKNTNAVKEAIDVLNQGGVIGIYPEGTRNKKNKELLPFKKGAAIMAKETNSKVIPFAITGKYKFFSKDLTVKYGKAINISKLSIEEATELIKKEVNKLR